MKNILFALLLFVHMDAMAEGYSAWAVPTTVEIVSGGVLIHGAFGDPNGCGEPGYIFISQQNPAYDAALSMALSALHGNREMRFYSSKCTQVSFHWSGQVINENQGHQSIYIR